MEIVRNHIELSILTGMSELCQQYKPEQPEFRDDLPPLPHAGPTRDQNPKTTSCMLSVSDRITRKSN